MTTPIEKRRAANRAHQAELKAKVLQAIVDAGPEGATVHEIGNTTGIHPAAVHTARRSLMRAGEVEAAPKAGRGFGPSQAGRYRVPS